MPRASVIAYGGRVFKKVDLEPPHCVDDLVSSYRLDERVVSSEGGWRARLL